MISNNRYDLTNVEQFLLEIITKKINKNEACNLYKKMIEPKVIELTRAKSSRGKNKRLNILNISSIFEGVYFHYFTEPIIKESIADRVKLRRQRLDVIDENKEKTNNQLFTEYFNYSNPNTMIKILKDAGDEKKNKNMVESINEKLNKMTKIIKNAPEDEEYKNIIDIVERILELNIEKQLGVGLKILIPNQVLSRLPITLAQLKEGNNSEKLRHEIRQLLYSLYRF